MPIVKIDRMVYAATAAFLLFLLIFGQRVHWVEVETSVTPERDFYVQQAEQFRHGEIPRSPWHPLLYPLLSAGISPVTGDAFVAARILSSVAMALSSLLTYLIAKRVFGHPSALLAFAGMLLMPAITFHGVMAASDALFCAFALLLLYACLRNLESPSLRWTVMTGIAYALAFFTRYQVPFLLPMVLLSLWWARGQSWVRFTRFIVVFGIAATVVLLPQFVMNYKVFGSALHNDNWKNTVWLASGRPFSTLDSTNFDDFKTYVLHSPNWVRMFARNVRSLPGRPFRYMFVAAEYGYGIAGKLVGLLLIACMYGGLALCLFRPTRPKFLVVSYWGFYVLGLCATWLLEPRYLLPVLPICLMVAFHCLATVLGLAASPSASTPLVRFALRSRAGAGLVAASLVLALMAAAMVPTVRNFVARHPYAEVAAARRIERQYPNSVRVCGTNVFMQRLVPYTYLALPFPELPLQTRDGYSEMLRAFVLKQKIDLVLIGRMSMYNAPGSFLTAECPPPFLSPIFKSSDVTIYAVIKPAPAPAATTQARPS